MNNNAVEKVPVEFEMLEFSFVRLAIELQINEIKLKMLDKDICQNDRMMSGMKQQLDIFEGIRDKLFEAYAQELKNL